MTSCENILDKPIDVKEESWECQTKLTSIEEEAGSSSTNIKIDRGESPENSNANEFFNEKDYKTEFVKCYSSVSVKQEPSDNFKTALNSNENYKTEVFKCYSSVSVKQEPIENFKTAFKISLIEFETQKYHQEIFEQLLESSPTLKLKELQAQYIAHLRQAANIEIFTCSLCNYQTMKVGTLNCHFLINHNGKMEQEIFRCTKCDYQTNFPSHITRHLGIHKSLKEKSKKEETIKEKYPCNKCQYKGRSEEGLKRHMALHKDKTNCDLCSFKSEDQNVLREHKSTHKVGDKYQCYKCNYTNNNKLSLARHLLRTHEISNEASRRSKICEICSNSFSSIHQLRVHYVTHKSLSEMEESEIYKCTECDHKTKYKANFKLHMLVHRAPEYICDMCGFASKHKHSYENHLITHKKLSEIDWFRCSICPYKCRTKSQLRHHIKKGVHSDKNLRHIRNRDRIREAEERGEVFLVKRKFKQKDKKMESRKNVKISKLKGKAKDKE